MGQRFGSTGLRLKTITTAIMAALPWLAAANPVGPEVISGQVGFHQAGNTLTVTNSPGAIIHWDSFSIAQGEITRFVQQSAASQVLNRIVGHDPSQILGSLQSNGQVFLINPNGIVFGPNAQVDVAGLVVSPLKFSNTDFLAGRLSFSDDLEAGTIRNHGTIRTLGSGNIYLIAPSVENHGIIQAADGAVILAAGRKATLVDTHRPDVRVEISAPDNEALNVGSIIGGHVGIYGGAVRNEGSIQASQALQGSDGSIWLRASGNVITGSASRFTVSGASGGEITISGDAVTHAGTASASGANGGSIRIDSASRFTQTGSLVARGSSGAGGSIVVTSQTGMAQTLGAAIDATGARGGSITLSGGLGRTFLSGRNDASGAVLDGGSISVRGSDIALVGVTLSANGPRGGGEIQIGGGPMGARGIATATDVYASATTTLSANALSNGRGGDIILWSDGTTRVGATLSARGGAHEGDGGFIEVSGKAQTAFGGVAHASSPAGRAGTFLLDPKNIIIDDTAAGIRYRDLLDPNPNTDAANGNGWGQIIEFHAGNTLVTDPYDNAAGIRSGAIYLYRGSDGALLTALTGAAAEDGIGIGRRVDVRNNLLLMHMLFGSGNGQIASAKGAVTWIDPSTGLLSDGTGGGTVGTANSVVGERSGDRAGFVTPLASGGNGYFLLSENWNDRRGAITWIDVSTGRLGNGATGGAIGSANSLVGSAAGDRVGATSTGETNVRESHGNALILSPEFASGAGALSWISGATGRLADGSVGGVVSAANSFVGTAAGDGVGRLGATNVPNGFLFQMPDWNGARGALTWIEMATGRTPGGAQAGVIGAANSIVGGAAGDRFGADVRLLSSDHFLVLSPDWDGPAGLQDVGAVTWIRNTGALANNATSGTLSSATSLIGGAAFDRVGSGGIQELWGDHLVLPVVVISPQWGGAGVNANAKGAVTWLNGITGNTLAGTPGGVLAAENSLVGSRIGDRVGTRGDTADSIGGGITTTGFGQNFVVASPNWDLARGAVTFLSFSGNTAAGTAAIGAVGDANSLVGTDRDSRVGEFVDTLSNGHIVVRSPDWNVLDGDSISVYGAATWMNGASGLLAGMSTASQFTAGSTAVGPGNSVVGTSDGDRVGSGGLFNNGSTLLVLSPSARTFTEGGPVPGVVTWMDRNTGRLANMTSAADYAQLGGFISDRNSVAGNITPEITAVGSGAVLLLDRTWGSNRGALTWLGSDGRLANGATGGVVSRFTSLVGSSVGEGATMSLEWLNGGNHLLLTPDWSDRGSKIAAGAVTWISARNGRLANGLAAGEIGADNSIVGGAANDRIGSGGIDPIDYYYGSHIHFVRSPEWTDGGTKVAAGALTRFDANSGLLSGMTAATDFAELGGRVDRGNSLVGAHSGDRIGDGEFLRFNSGTGYGALIRHANFASGAGAITWIRGSDGMLADENFGGVVSTANSLVGSAAGDAIGSGGLQAVSDGQTGKFFVLSPDWSDAGTRSAAGAITWFDANAGTLSDGSHGGVVSATNSLVGTAAGDRIGSGGIRKASADGYEMRHFAFSPLWSDGGTKAGAGAVTWIDGETGHLIDESAGGAVSGANSLVGSAAGDSVGSGWLVPLKVAGSRGLILSPEWSAGGTQASTGAITWYNAEAGVLANGQLLRGAVSGQNSIVGTAAGDRVGSSEDWFSFSRLIDSGADRWSLIFSPHWSDGGTKAGAGAMTWIDSATGLLADMARPEDFLTTGGAISATNSLVGANAGDRVGGQMPDNYHGFQDFRPEGRYVGSDGLLLTSRGFANGAGAVTWLDLANRRLTDGSSGGRLGAANSLVGDRAGDGVGETLLSVADSFLVVSPDWHGGTGAVTWLNTATGRLVNGAAGGVVSAANSMVGTQSGDRIGANHVYGYSYNGRILFHSSEWNAGRGAATWMDGHTGLLANMTTADGYDGTVSAANSLVGERGTQPGTEDTGDGIGSTQVFTTFDYFIVMSGRWNDGRGAITRIRMSDGALIDGARGSVITAANSLVGSAAGDGVGAAAYPQFVSGGNWLLTSTSYSSGRGAVTMMPSDWSLVGELNARNSVIGSQPNAGLQTFDDTGFYHLHDWSTDSSLLRFATDGAGRIVVLSNKFASSADPPLGFSDFLGQDITVAPAVIERMLNSGTRVVLQANNDITIRKAILATGTSASDGALVLQAGRSILVNADVTNRNVDDSGLSIHMTAHESAAAGVVASERDAGAGEIRMAAGTTITGGGTVRLEVGSGAGAGTPGGIYLANVNGQRVEIINAVAQTIDAQRVIEQLINSTVRQTGPGTAGQTGVVVQAGGAILGATSALIAADSGTVLLTGRSVGAPAAPMRLASNGLVTATALAGGAFLEQPQGSAATGSYALSVPEDQPLSLSVPNGVLTVSEALNRSGSISFTGGTGLVVTTSVFSGGSIALSTVRGGIGLQNATIVSSGSGVSFTGESLSMSRSLVASTGGISIAVPGAVSIVESVVSPSGELGLALGTVATPLGSLTLEGATRHASVGSPSRTDLRVRGNVVIAGGANLGAEGACSGFIGGDLILTGGSADGASATLTGNPDIGSAASPLQIGGKIRMTTGSGANAFAAILANMPTTIYLDFPNRDSGGFTVDGQPVFAAANSGFFAGGREAVLGQNLFITYGGSRLAGVGAGNSPFNDLLIGLLRGMETPQWPRVSASDDDQVLPRCQ